ncbi:site-specific DNA-methyltransferase [Eggerthella sp. HF-4214]|uniref:Methyltransferase n=2 Tax=Eggerthella guodeyinii TaxID=2690837 RepID=A0A6N7RLN9_9ACTN|nr:site-specific DNA-methyltransferase [Eggerthella guodeyinii]
MRSYSLHHGDCMDVMRGIEPGSVDMVLADPPYCSGGLTRSDRKQPTSTKYQTTGLDEYHHDYEGDAMDERAFTLFTMEWARLARATMRPGASALVFSDWRQLANTCDAVQAAGLVFRGIVVWHKPSARPQPNSFRSDCEFAAWATNGAIDRSPTQDAVYLKGLYTYSVEPMKNRSHMNQKPVGLMRELIGICPQGGTVLDPFMGSGTTGIACADTGRAFVGIERDAVYFDIAERRVSAAYAQGRLEL